MTKVPFVSTNQQRAFLGGLITTRIAMEPDNRGFVRAGSQMLDRLATGVKDNEDHILIDGQEALILAYGINLIRPSLKYFPEAKKLCDEIVKSLGECADMATRKGPLQ